MKIIKITLSLCIILCTSLALNAKSISPDQARKAATYFYFERVNQNQQVAAKDLSISEEREVRKDGQLLYYVFNFSRGGWVLMSSDDRFIPVIGYSFNGNYGTKNMPCCFEFWMKKVDEQIAASLNDNTPALASATAMWEDLLTRDANNLPVYKSKAITPMLLSSWDQSQYYNALCPAASDGPDGHALVGCVATSMSQVMYYYRYPTTGLGTHSGLNLGSYTYRWGEMLNSLSNYNQGVAELCYHAGVTVNMSYGGTGSGAQTSDIPTALESHFRYDAACNYKSETMYSSSTWNGYMTSNLDAMHPVIYSGTDPTDGGHAWVCDGYQGTDYFHMNWGWGGYYDGYFYLNNLAAGGSNFSDWQGAVFDIYPPTASYPSYCTGTQTLTYTNGSIVDGSGPSNYSNNANCQWLIDPTEVIAKITISFQAFGTENTNDVVTIYDGNSTAAPVLATLSGSSLPANVVTTGDVALVVFSTNGSTTNSGWQLEYRSSYPVYCSGITTLTTPTGSIADGSGTNDYSINQLCRWRIQPTGAESITLDFTSLNLAADDFIYIYDEVTGLAQETITGSSIPAVETYPTSKILVVFKTNASNNAPGWSLNYTSAMAGIQETAEMGSIAVYPNPAQHLLNIDFSPVGTQDVAVDILSMDGRSVIHQDVMGLSSSVKLEMDISSLKAGLYMVRLAGKNGKLVSKLIVE